MGNSRCIEEDRSHKHSEGGRNPSDSEGGRKPGDISKRVVNSDKAEAGVSEKGDHVQTGSQLLVSEQAGGRYGSRLTVRTEGGGGRKNESRGAADRKEQISHIRVRKVRTDRTTRLLIAILCLFIISEFPQVIDEYYKAFIYCLCSESKG